MSASFFFPDDDDLTSIDSGLPSVTENSWIWCNQPEHIISTLVFDEGIYHSLQPCIICRCDLFVNIVFSCFYINSHKMVVWRLFHKYFALMPTDPCITSWIGNVQKIIILSSGNVCRNQYDLSKLLFTLWPVGWAILITRYLQLKGGFLRGIQAIAKPLTGPFSPFLVTTR